MVAGGWGAVRNACGTDEAGQKETVCRDGTPAGTAWAWVFRGMFCPNVWKVLARLTAAYEVLKKEEAAPLPVCAEVQVRKMMSCSHCGRPQTSSGICSTGSSHFTLLAKLRGKQRTAEASLLFAVPSKPKPQSARRLRQHKLVPELLMVIPALVPAANPKNMTSPSQHKPIKATGVVDYLSR